MPFCSFACMLVFIPVGAMQPRGCQPGGAVRAGRWGGPGGPEQRRGSLREEVGRGSDCFWKRGESLTMHSSSKRHAGEVYAAAALAVCLPHDMG